MTDKKLIIHYYWLRRWQSAPRDGEDFVDTACGLEIKASRATDNRFKATCKRYRRCTQ